MPAAPRMLYPHRVPVTAFVATKALGGATRTLRQPPPDNNGAVTPFDLRPDRGDPFDRDPPATTKL